MKMSAKWFYFLRPLLFAVLMQFVAFSTLTHAAVAPTGDQLALLAIKSKIIHDPQGIMASWNLSITDDLCAWPGVACGSRGVAALDLSNAGLVGTLSPYVGNLSFLSVIALSNNSFSGEIHPEIGRLFGLRVLDLSNNSFAGNIQATIMNCSNLEVLDLGYNHLVGRIPDGIGLLPMLRILFLDNNILEGTIPPSIYNCSSLERVSLDDNQLNGRLHENLGLKLPLLQLLSLSQNHIQGNLLDIPPTLDVLDLRSNNFWGKLPSLSNGSSPKVLALSDNFFMGSLHKLVCSNGVNMTRVLDLGNNQFSGVIPDCWEKWPSLVLLNLNNNKFSGEIPRPLGYMPSLQLLNMHGNKISGILPSSLMNLSNLKILQLGRNELVGSIPTWIGTKLTFLKILNLRSNHFYGNIPHQLCYLSHAKILDLAHNNLSGNIPGCFNNFSALSGKETNLEVRFSFSFGGWQSIVNDLLVIKGREDAYGVFLGLVMLLDLSSNNFSGQIPSELMALRKLKSLNLSRNQLTGKIPDQIGEMKSLESLDLSVNKLSEELPMSLSRLNFLSSFNVSYNNLIGKIPTSTQIQSLSESSFLGNKLCGPPLTNGCVPVKVRDTIIDQKENDGSHEADWVLAPCIVVGFVSGFWIVVAPLIASTSWKIAYFRLMSKLIKGI